MASGGQWRRRGEPFNNGDGTTAAIKNDRYDWTIDTNGRLPFASVLFEGRGEYKVFSGGRVKKYNQVYLYNDKKIYFPEDREMKLGLLQGHDCAKVCRGTTTAEYFIIDYNIENGGTNNNEKGKLSAAVAVFLSPFVANIDGSANRKIRDYASAPPASSSTDRTAPPPTAKRSSWTDCNTARSRWSRTPAITCST